MIDLFGRPEDRPLARLGYYITLPLLLIIGILLIVDLSRPLRFWHLMVEIHTWRPMFKWWSPMSVGTWLVLGFGVFAVLSFLGAFAESRRPAWSWARRLRTPGFLGGTIALLGALLALSVAGYTGVLLAVTNRPIWSDTSLLGMLFIVSAIAASAALMVLLAGRSRDIIPGVLALQRTWVWVIVLQFFVLLAVLVSLGPVARAWINAWGLVLLVGVILLGMAVPLMLYRRSDRLDARSRVTAALLVVAGGFILRTMIVFSPHGIEP